MAHLQKLPVYTMITTGRTGTDFLQSLLDSHPHVLTFNGHIPFGNFWQRSICVVSGDFDFADFIDEFVGHYIHHFKSRYDYTERKDCLGPNKDQSISIDTEIFKAHALKLMAGYSLNSRNSLISIYGAYALCLGQNLSEKKIIFHHEHNVEGIEPFLKDFSGSKIICMTRDPRANFVSGIENHRKYDSNKDNCRHLYNYIKRILADANVLSPLGHPYVVIRLEDLGQKGILVELCRWLGIDYHECMEESTWGGLLWHGDRLSKGKKQERGFALSLIKNNWQKKMTWMDKCVFNYLMNNRLRAYNYSVRNIYMWEHILVPILILFPLSYEWRFLSPRYVLEKLKQSDYRGIVSNLVYYIKRILLFYVYYRRSLLRLRWRQPLLKVTGQGKPLEDNVK